MKSQSPLFRRLVWRVLLFTYMLIVAMPQPLNAQEKQTANTAAQAVDAGDPIFPDKPKLEATPIPVPKPDLKLVRFYTVPEQVRALEPFELHVEIKNVGTRPAVDYFVENKDCADTGKFNSEGECFFALPSISVDQTIHIMLRLRYTGTLNEGTMKEVGVIFTDDLKKSTPDLTTKIAIFVLPSNPIIAPTARLQAVLPKPNIAVNRTWTAKARATIDELSTPLPLIFNSTLISANHGGPEFELVVELKNLGDVAAANLVIDFCNSSDKFNPVFSGCRKQVPTTLSPGGVATASQTLAYRNDTTPASPPPRGDNVQFSLSYEFVYASQWVSETVQLNAFLYPQTLPALTPTPTDTPATPYLIVDTPQLNLRTGPGTTYPIIGVAHTGARFSVIGKDHSNQWWQIVDNGTPAWVHGYYVVAHGVERVPVAADIPPPPPPTPEPPATSTPPAPTRTPNPDPVGQSETVLTPIPVLGTPSWQAHPAPLPVDYTGPPENGEAAAPQVVLGQDPLVVIESYQTVPGQLVDDQPFQLTLVLRNLGGATAQQLMVSWRDRRVLPIGLGTTQWLNDLAPGGRAALTGQFVLATPPSDPLVQLPVTIVYVDARGRVIERTEPLVLLWQHPPPATTRPWRNTLWVRLLFGLVGLGAER